MRRIILSLFIIMLIFASGCGKVANVSGLDTGSIAIEQQSSVKAIKGTVNYYDIEGGFWGLTTTGGQNYLLIDSNNKSFQNKREYLVSGQPHPDWITFKMWGTPFEVSSASIVK